jgi:hypothetical protein
MREQRTDARVKSRLTVQLQQGHGVVRDLSATGIYFVTDVPLKAGQPLKFKLEFKDAGAGGMSATCTARILRVEKQGKLKGVAASINEITFYAPIPRAR